MAVKEIGPDTKISVEGFGMYSYGAIAPSVVCIANKYYMRHDKERVIAIKNEQGKVRFFRNNSPLICTDSDGVIALKSMCYKTDDEIYHNKLSPNVVEIDKKYYRKTYCVQIEGKWFLKADANLVSCYETGVYISKSSALQLSEKYYGKDCYVTNKAILVKTTEGDHLIISKDRYERFDTAAGGIVIHHRKDPDARSGTMVNVLVDFQDKTNPQEDRLVFRPARQNEVFNMQTGTVSDDYLQYYLTPGGSMCYLYKGLLPYFAEAVEKYIMPRYLTKLEAIKAALNKTYSDLDETENLATAFKHVNKPFPGKHPIHRANSFGIPIKSKTFDMTGGLQYSFGIEMETSDGLLTNEEIDSIGVFCVGDRSVGSGEYVTSPLVGDKGIEHLEAACKMLSKRTLVDDRCGIHVHVGSVFTPTVRKPTPAANQAPSFSKQFLINAINLGALVEEELYKSLPKNRKPTLYHCHSIKRFGGVTEANFDERVGAYCFGPKEHWSEPTEQCPHKLFNFKDYKLNKDRNHTSQLGTWAEGRYKWLNLIPSYTASPHRTIEFRIFSGSTSFEKIYMYLLTSLAFTWFADNCTKLIVPGVTLSQVFEEAYKGHPKLIKKLNTFYAERTKKFNRGNIYPNLDLPFLK